MARSDGHAVTQEWQLDSVTVVSAAKVWHGVAEQAYSTYMRNTGAAAQRPARHVSSGSEQTQQRPFPDLRSRQQRIFGISRGCQPYRTVSTSLGTCLHITMLILRRSHPRMAQRLVQQTAYHAHEGCTTRFSRFSGMAGTDQRLIYQGASVICHPPSIRACSLCATLIRLAATGTLAATPPLLPWVRCNAGYIHLVGARQNHPAPCPDC